MVGPNGSMVPEVPVVSEKKWRKSTEWDRHRNPNHSPFCMEWKQISVFLVVVRYGRLPKVGVAHRAWHVVFVVDFITVKLLTCF